MWTVAPWEMLYSSAVAEPSTSVEAAFDLTYPVDGICYSPNSSQEATRLGRGDLSF